MAVIPVDEGQIIRKPVLLLRGDGIAVAVSRMGAKQIQRVLQFQIGGEKFDKINPLQHSGYAVDHEAPQTCRNAAHEDTWYIRDIAVSIYYIVLRSKAIGKHKKFRSILSM